MSILSPRSPFLPNTAAFIGLVPTLLGFSALVWPRSVLTNFEFPAPKTPDGLRLSDSLCQLFGVRDVALGLMVLVIRLRGDRVMLGQSLLLGALLPLGDGAVSLSHIGGGAWKHWAFIPVMVAVGGALMGWGQ
ncbi:hypothetical protein GQ53DRAFT_745366 [Thozetella sp. PMI_491]|nr:hypothetical protein GQ53DRAFT_745366 [Thozetella sp. PMI_491]